MLILSDIEPVKIEQLLRISTILYIDIAQERVSGMVSCVKEFMEKWFLLLTVFTLTHLVLQETLNNSFPIILYFLYQFYL